MSQNDKSPLSSTITLLKDGVWLKGAVDDALLFWRFCLLPAVLFGLANISLIISMNTLTDTASLENQTLQMLSAKLLTAGISSLLGIILTIWSLTVWLDRLTAFCRLRLEFDGKQKNSAVKAVLLDIAKNQKSLYKFWFVYSFYLLIPVIPLTFFVLAQSLAFSPSLAALHLVDVPPHLNVILNAGIAVLTIITAGMTIAAMARAAKLDLPARKAAYQSVKLFLKNWLALCLVTAIVLLLNTAISAPQVLVGLASKDLPMGIIEQVWLALTSSILWTLSLCPALELLRRDLVAP